MAKNPWTLLNRKVKYENPWIRVEEDQVIHPGGRQGIYGTVNFHNQAVGIIALDDDDHIYLVGQYRYPLNQYHWEIPMGGCPKDEQPLACAKRELLEETGLKAANWRPLGTYHISNSITDEVGHLFLCKDLFQGKAQPEDTEILELKKLPFETALHAVLNGEITDALSVIAIQKVRLLNLA